MTRKSRSFVENNENNSSNATNIDETNENEVQFEWVGPGVKENRLMYFWQCKVNGVEVSIGNNVEIKLGDNQSAVAEILELYEQAGQDPHRATIRWYYPYKDLPKRCKLYTKKCNNAKELYKVQEYFLGSEENIDAETIINKVSIAIIGVDDDIPDDTYFIRYVFTATGNGNCVTPILFQSDEEDLVQTEKGASCNNFTKVKAKSQRNVNDADSVNPSAYSDEYIEPEKVKQMSGKMKKNAMRWKTFSTDEVIAELWKTDEKDTNGGMSRRSNGASLKRKMKSTPKDNLLTYSSCDTDNNVSPPDSKADGESAAEASDMSSQKIDYKTLVDVRGGDFEERVEGNKKVSPFKALPKKKERSRLSVFDFNDDDGELRSKPSSKRMSVISDDDYKADSDFSDEYDGTFSPKKTPKNGKKKKIVRTSENKSTRKSSKKTKALFGKVGTTTPPNGSSVPLKKDILNDKTPSISQRKDPLTDAKTTLELARKRLHVSEVPETLPCRDHQFEQIFSFVQDRLKEGTGGCMYISGVPGTGKTATVHEVIRTLKESTDEALIPQFKYVEINGMKLTDPNQAYSQILKELDGKKATPDHAADLLDQRFRSITSVKENVVLLVDELDLLCTRKQNVMYNIFDWPTHQNSKLVVLAVANTMDLPERVMMNRVSSRLGLTRMTFQPYTFKELQEIVLSRIRWIEAFEEDALQLVARKVAAVSGDARRCLDICRRAVEISETSNWSRGRKTNLDGKGMVGMKHVEMALKEMFSSPKIIALQCLADMEARFMKAVISEFRRTGLEEALFIEVYDQFKSHCTLEDGIDPPNISEAFTVCNNLGTCRLLLVEAGDKDIHQRIRLNVNADDVMFAFKSRES